MSAKDQTHLQGDVVLVNFPSAMPSGTKRRPAVIVSNNARNADQLDVLVAPLTSNMDRAHLSDRTLSVAMNSPDGRAAGLRFDSVVDCSVIATIPKTLIVSKLGKFSDHLIERMIDSIKGEL